MGDIRANDGADVELIARKCIEWAKAFYLGQDRADLPAIAARRAQRLLLSIEDGC